MDTRLLVPIMHGSANFDINFEQSYSLHRANGMLAQRGQNYEHVHIISITQISFSYVQISVSIQIRRS
jgi:hypothetical protein